LIAVRKKCCAANVDARARLDASVAGERAKLNAQASDVAMAAARKILGREVAS